MAALVKLTTPTRIAGSLRLQTLDGVDVRSTQSGFAVQLACPHLIQVGGDRDGERIDGTVVKPNQRVCLSFGTVKPDKYHVVVEANPELARYGVAQCPTVGEPGEELRLDVYLRADRSLDTAALAWGLRVYLLD
jgi:hypothetical protein